ncbi:hypothetical protein WHI96_19625 [Pseudonocardia tropica]|uniref:Uncharacterized protein n=3 Tax=Pseudonocardia TaxID=1847 RepID=A0A4Q7USL5_PSEST|nr:MULTISPECIES: hypothetical protein [Pseudonocardia]MYW75195.1 hypothetical protein [Pseudonocardia sp. SID8383]RZT83954.1 hypothetical protein EV383_0784 [Pseudonocardia sediminis]
MHTSLPRHAHTTTDPTDAQVVPVARLVEAGLRRTSRAIRDTARPSAGDLLAHAARARRLAELHTRRARWWAILQRDTATNYAPVVYVQAVVTAVMENERQARYWTDTADDWQALADGRPTSDVAGAMSNWADLGLTDPAAPGLPDTSAVAR